MKAETFNNQIAIGWRRYTVIFIVFLVVLSSLWKTFSIPITRQILLDSLNLGEPPVNVQEDLVLSYWARNSLAKGRYGICIEDSARSEFSKIANVFITLDRCNRPAGVIFGNPPDVYDNTVDLPYRHPTDLNYWMRQNNLDFVLIYYCRDDGTLLSRLIRKSNDSN